jgi:hypothetical protein
MMRAVKRTLSLVILAMCLAACSGSGSLGGSGNGGAADSRDAWCKDHFNGSLQQMLKDLSDPNETVSKGLDEVNSEIDTFSQDERSTDPNISHYSSAIVAGLQDLHTWLMQTNSLADTLDNHFIGFRSAVMSVPTTFCP